MLASATSIKRGKGLYDQLPSFIKLGNLLEHLLALPGNINNAIEHI